MAKIAENISFTDTNYVNSTAIPANKKGAVKRLSFWNESTTTDGKLIVEQWDGTTAIPIKTYLVPKQSTAESGEYWDYWYLEAGEMLRFKSPDITDLKVSLLIITGDA